MLPNIIFPCLSSVLTIIVSVGQTDRVHKAQNRKFDNLSTVNN